jgi:hypothetical protein
MNTVPRPRPTPGKLTLLTVVWVLLVLVLFALSFSCSATFAKGQRTATMTLMEALDTAAVSYTTDNGPLPKNLNNHILWADLSGADSGKVYMNFKTSQMNDKGEVIDPWGTPLQVGVAADGSLQLRSAADDKIFGTQDDITSQ